MAKPSDDVWMSVLLDGRKIGQMHTTRALTGDRVITTQNMQIEIARAGLMIVMSTGETDEETRDGKPLRFESRTRMSGVESIQSGIVHPDGSVDITSSVGGANQKRNMRWPAGALLAEGLRLQEEKSGLAAGTRFKSIAFQVENLEAAEVDSVIGAKQSVDLPDGARDLVRVEQSIVLDGVPTKTLSWVDADQTARKLLIPMMGYELTMLACSKACATAPNQGADILVHSLVAAPTQVSAADRASGLRIVVDPTDSSGEALRFATTDEQQVEASSGKTILRIAPISNASAVHEDKPTVADTQPNDWLQSNAPEILKLARQGAGDAKSPQAKMQNLENFVRTFIRNKDLSVGYASALEVAKNPEGDCTEHAVLLAALARALDIPARVVDGLVYTDHYAGGDHVFVPHAWAQAYVDGHWQSFDAALNGFDAGHVALSAGDGDPWRFFAAFNTLGRLRVESIAPLR